MAAWKTRCVRGTKKEEGTALSVHVVVAGGLALYMNGGIVNLSWVQVPLQAVFFSDRVLSSLMISFDTKLKKLKK